VVTSRSECSLKAEFDMILMMPTLIAVSSAKQVDMRENYRIEMVIAATPGRQKKAYTPKYIPTFLFGSLSLASDHQSSQTAIV
jgi:hypothetical protein